MKTITQLSVFLENKPGQLATMTRFLAGKQVNLRALSLSETLDFGIVRIIVDAPEKTALILGEGGYVCTTTQVLAAELADVPGSMAKVMEALGNAGISLEYTYAFTGHVDGMAYTVFRVQDNEKAIQVLTERGVRLLAQEELTSAN